MVVMVSLVLLVVTTMETPTLEAETTRTPTPRVQSVLNTADVALGRDLTFVLMTEIPVILAEYPTLPLLTLLTLPRILMVMGLPLPEMAKARLPALLSLMDRRTTLIPIPPRVSPVNISNVMFGPLLKLMSETTVMLPLPAMFSTSTPLTPIPLPMTAFGMGPSDERILSLIEHPPVTLIEWPPSIRVLRAVSLSTLLQATLLSPRVFLIPWGLVAQMFLILAKTRYSLVRREVVTVMVEALELLWLSAARLLHSPSFRKFVIIMTPRPVSLVRR